LTVVDHEPDALLALGHEAQVGRLGLPQRHALQHQLVAQALHEAADAPAPTTPNGAFQNGPGVPVPVKCNLMLVPTGYDG